MLLLFCPSPLDIKDVEWWKGNYSLTADYAEFYDNATSGDSNQYYQLANSMDGNQAMLWATDDTVYLDRCLLYINEMIADAKLSSTISASQYKDSYYGWPSSAESGRESILREVYCFRFVCMVLDYIKDKGLTGEYLTQYNNIYTWMERNIWQKWWSRGTSNMYYVVIHICSHIAIIANFFRRRSSNATIIAQAATYQDNVDHLGISVRGNSHMRSQLHNHPVDARWYFWNMYWDGIPASGKPVENYGSDYSHGQALCTYVTRMIDLGYGDWSITDTTRFAGLFKNILWISPNSVWNYLIGSGGTTVYTPANINDGFNKLGRYDREVQKLIETVSSSRNAQHWGNGALNARRLLGV